jgi:hypothetical protein
VQDMGNLPMDLQGLATQLKVLAEPKRLLILQQRFAQVIDMMRAPERSTFAFVIYPEATSILEAYRAVEVLRPVGVEPELVVARILHSLRSPADW